MHPIDSSLIQVPLRCETKFEAIGELLDLMAEQGLVTDREQVYQQLLERESKKSTAIGYGAAIPHVRTEFVQDTVCAFGSTFGEPIDFSNDGEPTSTARLLFLMVSPRDDAPTHLRTLAMIARLIKDEERRTSLIDAREPQLILELLGDLARTA
jgi:mannitol/fructose-specific phosphotransferase system IIA component (Ntr-type)